MQFRIRKRRSGSDVDMNRLKRMSNSPIYNRLAFKLRQLDCISVFSVSVPFCKVWKERTEIIFLIEFPLQLFHFIRFSIHFNFCFFVAFGFSASPTTTFHFISIGLSNLTRCAWKRQQHFFSLLFSTLFINRRIKYSLNECAFCLYCNRIFQFDFSNFRIAHEIDFWHFRCTPHVQQLKQKWILNTFNSA